MNSRTFLATRFTTLALTGALALGSLLTSGCAARSHVSYVPTTGDVNVAKPNADVEVLLDRAPGAPHIVTGELFATSFSNPQGIELMRRKAAEAGLDGIYWIDCTSTCSGHCSAKGYVYVDRSMAKGGSQHRVASED